METLHGLIDSRPLRAVLAAVRRGRQQAGQGMVEYALILMLMAMVVLVLLSVVGRETSNVFSNVATGISQ